MDDIFEFFPTSVAMGIDLGMDHIVNTSVTKRPLISNNISSHHGFE